ncbi:MAG: NINE protein [Luteibaculaceae bacterium]
MKIFGLVLCLFGINILCMAGEYKSIPVQSIYVESKQIIAFSESELSINRVYVAESSLYYDGNHLLWLSVADSASNGSAVKNKKWIAITAAVLLGPFGGHRLYLGTNEKVPVIYTLTLGGGLGLLPLIDIIHIIFTKDLSKFEQNERVFMWGGE